MCIRDSTYGQLCLGRESSSAKLKEQPEIKVTGPPGWGLALKLTVPSCTKNIVPRTSTRESELIFGESFRLKRKILEMQF